MGDVRMNLEKLQALREQLPDVHFPIPEEELLARYEALYTGAVSDVLRELALTDQALPPSIHPLRDEMKVAGFAFTIRSVVDPTLKGEMETRVEMLEHIRPNTVCVWNANGDDDAAHWGEVMTATAKKRGCKGAVVDGGLRDTAQVLAQNFPVWYRYRSPNGTLSRCKITGYQVPVKIGKVIVRPGDLIFGDIDGVVVVPRELAYDVLLRAEEIKAGERIIREWVSQGMSTSDIAKRGGYF
ncbi:RraA family protein [Geochorda subterranea]|uniref:Putative 4-hydroxy-4-methyl-2-oxoglutarate aldolase n=1 Tax=Geochorda subterranea TaxID=3109564 RepID=A0ABZ1BP73_9FIRM|nr:RraA family protein [Limnochorda sp. LNt]WRP14524.1 RraA family protein [Limnochorda sp. LNt]